MGMLRKRFWGASEKPPAVVYSKMKCVAALTAAGVWPQVKAWIEANGFFDLYLAAQDFNNDNEYFSQARAGLQGLLGWSDEQVEELLSLCVAQ